MRLVTYIVDNVRTVYKYLGATGRTGERWMLAVILSNARLSCVDAVCNRLSNVTTKFRSIAYNFPVFQTELQNHAMTGVRTRPHPQILLLSIASYVGWLLSTLELEPI
eukprot:6951243-Pyramimonas_sp.AAC.1